MVSIESKTEGSRRARSPASRTLPKDSVCAYESCTLLDGNPCQPCHKAIVHEALLIRAQTLQQPVERLLNEYTVSLREINREHDRLIHRFPLEITSYIFELCLPNDWHTLDERRCMEKTDIAAPLILGAVCHIWRTIAWSLPQLWTYLPFTYRLTLTDPVASRVTLAAEWLSRSGQYPLSIIVYSVDSTRHYKFLDDQMLQADVLRGLQPLMSVLNDYSHRWKYLDLQIPGALMTYLFGQPIEQPVVVHDTLQSLNLSVIPRLKQLSKMSLPALQSLTVRSYADHIPFSNLVDLVSNCGNCGLTSLDLIGYRHDSNGHLNDLLKHTPLLKKLYLDVGPGAYWDCKNLFQLLGRTSTDPVLSNLTDLRLRLRIYGKYPHILQWGHVADIFGPIEDCGKAGRRPLSLLQVNYEHSWGVEKFEPIDKDALSRFLKIAQTGVILKLEDVLKPDNYVGKTDLLQTSKEHHGFV